MKKLKLTKQEKAIENALLNNEYVSVSNSKFDSMAKAVAARKEKSAILQGKKK